MHTFGAELRGARLAWQLTLREVQDRSLAYAKHWGNPRYSISASWLDRVERENRGLSATKLIVLAAIYGLTPEQMLALCPIGKDASSPPNQFSGPNSTLLLTNGLLQDQATSWLPDKLVTDVPPEETTLLPSEGLTETSRYRRGIIGRRDRTLEPMIRAGSIVLIDTHRRAIAARKEWHHEFDRPIYFILTRTGYVLGFCELDKASDWLTLVPHALSYETSKRWKYRKEVEVIGTVDGVFMRRVA